MSEPSNTSTEFDNSDFMLSELDRVRQEKVPFGKDSLYDYGVRTSNFQSDLLGRLIHRLSKTPEGRALWLEALEAVGTYADKAMES